MLLVVVQKGTLLSFDNDLIGLAPISTANLLLDRGDQELSFEVLVAIIGALEAKIWLLKAGACIGSEFMLTRALSSFTTKAIEPTASVGSCNRRIL